MKRSSVVAVVFFFTTFPARAQEKPGGLAVDKEKRTITIDCKIAPRKMDDPKFQGKTWPLEVVACYPYPKGQKAHETLVTIDINSNIPLYQNAFGKIGSTGIIGSKFVELVPGTPEGGCRRC